MSAALRYPLHWPETWKRATSRPFSRFGGSQARPTIGRALDALDGEVRRLVGSAPWVLSSNLRLRNDGWPAASQSNPDDPGVAIYFSLKKREHALACDRWRTVAENIWALAKHIDALRGMDRWGVGSVEQAFGGYAALPPSADDWWLVLEIPRASTVGQIEAAFRDKAFKAHPDRGGDHALMSRINAAREAALCEKAGAA